MLYCIMVHIREDRYTNNKSDLKQDGIESNLVLK